MLDITGGSARPLWRKTTQDISHVEKVSELRPATQQQQQQRPASPPLPTLPSPPPTVSNNGSSSSGPAAVAIPVAGEVAAVGVAAIEGGGGGGGGGGGRSGVGGVGGPRRNVAECWHVIFAPDETRFAWLCGTSRVLIVPWNRFKNCLLSVDNTDDEGNEIKTSQVVCIDTGSPVNSAGFGSGTPESQLVQPAPQRNYWTRFDFTSQEMIFATGHVNGRIRIWDVCTGRKLLELMDHTEAVRDLAFAPDGSLRLVSASLDHTIKVWDLRDDGNMFKTLKGHSKEVFWCCWSPNGKLLASSGVGKSVFIWNMCEGYELARILTGHHHNVTACEFSPDGAVLATCSYDTRVILWDPHTGEQLRSLCHQFPPPRPIFASGANGSWVRGVAYARNGCQLATINDDGIVRFWNLLELDDGEDAASTVADHWTTEDLGGGIPVNPCAIALGDEDMVCCTFSPSGRVLAVGTKESRVSFYAAPAVHFTLKHLARMAVRRQLAGGGGETNKLDDLHLPKPLKAYLKYEQWH